MGFQVTDAFADGFDDFASGQGAVLAVVYVVLGLINTVLVQTALEVVFRVLFRAADIPQEAIQEAGGFGAIAPLSLGLPLTIVVPLILLFAIVGFPLTIVAIRMLASDSSELVPAAATDGLLKASALLFGARLLAGIAIGLGSLLLVIPGIIVWVLLVFVNQEIALNDAGIVDALSNSVDIVTDNAIGVIAVIVALVLIAIGVMLPVWILGGLLPPAIGPILTTTINGIVGVFGIAVITAAYQLAVADDTAAVGPDDEPAEL